MDGREMYGEVNALMGAIAKAFSLTAEEAVRAVETGDVAIDMATDERGQRFISLRRGDKMVRLYQGALLYEGEQTPEPAEDDGGCGSPGCGCGH